MPITFDPVEPLDPSTSLMEGAAKIRMLLVGVNVYQDDSLLPLNFAVQDCKKLSEAFQIATEQFPQRCIVTQTDIDAEMPFSIDDLNTSLDRVLEGLTADDTFLFYFSGHGALDKFNQQLYLCLPQTQLQNLPSTGLGIDDLLKRTNASGVGKQVVILDACHSGSVSFPKGRRPISRNAEENPISISDSNFTPKLEEALKAYKPGSGKRFFALFSCKAEQQSWELPELGHGAFTFHLIQGLRGEAKDGTGCIDSYHLYKYVTRQTNQYVSKRWGRRQDPDQISSGDPNIVLGLGQQPTSSQPPTGLGGGIALLEGQFRDFVWQLLKEQRDLQDATTRHQILQFAEQRYLSRERADRLEAKTAQDFNDVLKSYEERTTRRLYERGTQAFPFEDLRTDLFQTHGLLLVNIEPAEASSLAHFQQHQDNYLEAFSREIHHQPTLSPETHQELRSTLVNLGFSDGVIDSFEAEAWQALEQHQQTYRVDYRSAIYQYESPDGEALDQLQQQLGLGDRPVNLIESEQDDLCNQQKQAYRQEFAQAIHTNLMAAPVQDRRDLGAEILDRIEAEETEQCDRHKQDYRQCYAHVIRQQPRLRTQDYNELGQVQQQCRLSDEIVEALEVQENIDFDQEKQTYRNAYCNALHREQPLSAEGLDLLRQLQAKLNLGPEIVTSLQAEAAETFEQNRQRYFREYDGTIRQREKQSPSDRQRLIQTQQRLGLSNHVADLIRQSADMAVEQDKSSYRSTLDEALRYPEDTIAQERLAQMRQQCELGEELRQSLETEVERLVEHDRNEYCDVLVSELHGACPLSLEAQHRLRQLQNHLRLGDTIVAEVRETVTQDFGRRREKEERDREEARRQEEKTQEAARKREEARRQEEERKREALNSESSPLPIPAVPILIAPIVPVLLDETPIDLTPEPPQPPADSPRKFPLWAAIMALGVVGAIGVVAYSFLVKAPEDPKPTPSPSASVQPRSYQAELKRARKLKDEREFLKAIDEASKIPKTSPEFNDAKQLIEDAAKQIQNAAENYYNQGDLKAAIDTIKKIPETSSVYAKVQTTIDTWQKNWQADDTRYKAVVEADKKSDWDTVIREGEKITHPYWKKRVNSLLQKARNAKQPEPVQNRDPAPNYPDPTPQNRDPVPNYSDPTPQNRDSAPNYPDPPPQNRDPVPNYPDPPPQNRDPVPNYPDPTPTPTIECKGTPPVCR